MVDRDIKLTVYHDANGVFTDLTESAFDFSRDSFNLTLTQTTGYLYIGFRKPFNSLYFGITTANSNSSTLTMQYHNGTSWTDLEAQDDTKGFSRSGFIQWASKTDKTRQTINSKELYWIRVQVSATTSAMTLSGISFLFADDNDLAFEVPEITDSNHLAGKASHILTHVAVRNQIIQDLRNKDYTHTNQTTGLKEDLTVWDILEANQLKQAAVFLALSKIYFNFSDEVGDKWEAKSNYYHTQYQNAMKLARISLDEDDDGKLDDHEQLTEFKTLRLSR